MATKVVRPPRSSRPTVLPREPRWKKRSSAGTEVVGSGRRVTDVLPCRWACSTRARHVEMVRALVGTVVAFAVLRSAPRGQRVESVLDAVGLREPAVERDLTVYLGQFGHGHGPALPWLVEQFVEVAV